MYKITIALDLKCSLKIYGALGYRPILDAMRTFAVDGPAGSDIEELARLAAQPCSKLACARACKAPSARDAHVLFQSGQYVWTRPLSLAEVFDVLSQYSGQVSSQPYRT